MAITETPLAGVIIYLTGTLLTVDGNGNLTSQSVTNLNANAASSIQYLTNDLYVFDGHVDVSLSVENDAYEIKPFLSNPTVETGVIVFNMGVDSEPNCGSTSAEALGQKGIIRCSVNGKDPSHSKNYMCFENMLYRFMRNYTGDDNTILKARGYYRGKASAVTTAKFKVINTEQSYTA